MTDSEKLDEILRLLRAGAGTAAPSAAKVTIADDKLFHGQYGNPEIRVEPKEWSGPSLKGQHFSDAPVEWLDAAADMFDRFGAKAEKEGRVNEKTGKPNAWMDYQKAALARRWAAEKRKEGSPKKAPVDLFDTEDAPF